MGNKFSWLALGIALAALLVAFARPVGQGMVSPPEKETAYDRVVKTGKLRCGYAISDPEMIKDPNTGKLSGLDYDIWQKVGEELGIEIVWSEEAGWGNFIEGLRDGRYDAFCSAIWADDTRAKFLSLSLPVRYSLEYAYVRADDHRFDGDLEKLNQADVTTPVIDGDVSAASVKEGFPQAHLLSLPQTATISDMFESVVTHKADVVFFDRAMFSGLDKSNPGQLRFLENTPPVNTYANYFSFDAKEISLRDMVNVALRNLIDSGKMEKMAKSYSPDYGIVRKNYEVTP